MHRRHRHPRPHLLVVTVLSFHAWSAAPAQRPAADPAAAASSRPPATGWEVAALPALNFDADEGFGYGAIVELYDYGRGARPYRLTIQPTLFLTTAGRRDVTLFVDAPHVLPADWRATAYLGREQQLAQPYYGVGNASIHDEAAEREPNPYFYRFGRTRVRTTLDLQHALGRTRLRLLVGGGASNTRVDLTPFDSGTTLIASEYGGVAPPVDRERWVRAGLVWDSRDREVGPTRGTWADALVQRVDRRLGSTEDFTRWTVTARHYIPLSSRVTFAQRVIVQGVDGDAPFHELATIQSSFKQLDGVGGASSVRGLPKDRYVGKGTLLGTAELRWRARSMSILGRPSALVLSGFADAGRVWSEEIEASALLEDLHVGIGGGTRIAYGESFVVALDVAHSSQSTASIYIGLGYLF